MNPLTRQKTLVRASDNKSRGERESLGPKFPAKEPIKRPVFFAHAWRFNLFQRFGTIYDGGEQPAICPETADGHVFSFRFPSLCGFRPAAVRGCRFVMADFSSQLPKWIQQACVLEAAARKPGNVHPGASFADLSYADFVKSAEVIAPILANADEGGVGETIFRAATATRNRVGNNSNLGILLLLAPLAIVPQGIALEEGVSQVLADLTVEDAAWVYRAIRAVQPGGMGDVAEGDVSQEPTGTLLEMMRLAADRDRIAAEYVTRFSITLNDGLPFLAEVVDFAENWEAAVIELHLRLMAKYPDTLIARKCGKKVAEESARRARRVLEAESFLTSNALRELDDWLREEGHRRNPGTTADLIAASLFAGFREGRLIPPDVEARSEE